MNKGTDRNILTQLDISSDEYGLVTVLYTVSRSKFSWLYSRLTQEILGTLHSRGNPLQPSLEEVPTLPLAVSHHAFLVSDSTDEEA